ncbi:MAG: SUMF1/EgtB/PvdO family nonheme iron enzyme [Bradyrhizobium sp.]|uniref:SUMF1/EgtB/PvdO family nonheme iron enzyme n=1 Tax=Bradyrhizobium sp. TaxID=376 RepID=UPI001DFA9169|nr:SUMF1/EgtB/PvdO family nonheme iron enzyme [Bradyrhizobium sp.]MBV9562470.1 SUMF1/EgtB/PvdO family nonheme iron enzyme [Bradyrhizobium sp.]
MRSSVCPLFPIIVLVLVLVVPRPALCENRVALIIGNGAYQNVKRLPNPPNDASDVAAALRRLGFQIILATDLNENGMEDAIILFARTARTADVALFYYSGHAFQFNGINYLAPVDAKLIDDLDLRRMTRVDEIVSYLQSAKNLRILILDSCRNNPFAEQLSRSIGTTRAMPLQQGLAKIDTPQGMIVSYATQAGQTAEDGEGRNSPYTRAFLRHIEGQDEIGDIFRKVSEEVFETTRHSQLPELSLSLISRFYLRGTVKSTPSASKLDACASAADHWHSAEAIGTIDALQDHLARFPACEFAVLAQVKIDTLLKQSCGAAITAGSPSSRTPCPLTPAEERSLKPKDEFKECDKCPEMVVVPAGRYVMGSPQDELARSPDEGPQHSVTIARSFAVGKYHVTVDQFAAFMDETGYKETSGCAVDFVQTGSDPAVCVSWDDARTYVHWLEKKTGKDYRLLSEAEWEYSARAGTTMRYFFGNDDKEMCRYGNAAGKCDGYDYTSPVGHFLPNGFGLYDMHGNTWQWVEDCYHDSYVGAPSDGSAWMAANCNVYVLRGGSWYYDRRYLRSAIRIKNSANVRNDNYGFRLGRTLSP